MKPCEDYLELISARIDGELTPDEARRLDEHLAACEACRGELAEAERVWQGLGMLSEPRVSAGLAERVFTRATGGRGGSRRFGVPRWAWGPLATVAAVLVAFVFGYYTLGEKPLDADTTQIVQEMDLLQNLDVLEHFDTVEQLGEGVLLLTGETTQSGGGS